MKKKKISLLLICALVLMLSAGCGQTSTADEAESSETESYDESDDSGSDTSDAETETDSAEDVSGEDTSEDDASAEDGSDVLNGAAIEEQEIYNDGDIIITANDLSYDGYYYVVVGLTIENNSEEDITVRVMAGCAVNGYSMNMGLYEKVSAGMIANGEIDIPLASLEEAGIETITDIVFEPYIYILDEDGVPVSVGEEELVTIETTASDYEQIYDDSGEVIYDEGGIKIVYREWYYDGEDLYLAFYVENNLDCEIYMVADVGDNHTLNGADLRPNADVNVVYAGDRTITHLVYESGDLEAEGITDPEEAVIYLSIDETTEDGGSENVTVGPIEITF